MLCDKNREFYLDNPSKKMVCEEFVHKTIIEVKCYPKEGE